MCEVYVEGIYKDAMLLISYEFDLDEVNRGCYCAWSKPVSMWSHQEILAEDIRSKYLGKIKKIEQNLPALLEKKKIEQNVFKLSDQKTDNEEYPNDNLNS